MLLLNDRQFQHMSTTQTTKALAECKRSANTTILLIH